MDKRQIVGLPRGTPFFLRRHTRAQAGCPFHLFAKNEQTRGK